MTRIAERYQRLLARRAPTDDRVIFRFSEGFERERGESTKYLLGAMRSLEPRYTKKLQEQGDRVAAQLKEHLADAYPGLELERQGSVSNDTHIRYYSDVDVLALIDKYYALEPPQVPLSPYPGIPEDDLLALRRRCLQGLGQAFPAVHVDDSGSRAIRLTGGSLACPVDVVPSNWYDTVAYSQTGQKQDRAIQVLDRETRTRHRNQPFLVNHRIEQNDRERRGAPRMFIRLVKTVKADLEEEERTTLCISSFDICAIVYRMPLDLFAFDIRRSLELVRGLLVWMSRVLQDETLRGSLRVIDETRLVFDDGSKISAFHRVFNSLCSVYDEATKERQTYGDLITESR